MFAVWLLLAALVFYDATHTKDGLLCLATLTASFFIAVPWPIVLIVTIKGFFVVCRSIPELHAMLTGGRRKALPAASQPTLQEQEASLDRQLAKLGDAIATDLQSVQVKAPAKKVAPRRVKKSSQLSPSIEERWARDCDQTRRSQAPRRGRKMA